MSYEGIGQGQSERRPLSLNPESTADAGLMEILAYSSNARSFFDQYRLDVLRSLRPDFCVEQMLADGLDEEDTDTRTFRPVQPEPQLRQTLTTDLGIVVSLAARELYLPYRHTLSAEQHKMLHAYCAVIHQASLAHSQDLVAYESAIGQLQNPLANPELTEWLWNNWIGKTNRKSMPRLADLICFDEAG